MPRDETITTTYYKFDELTDEAKEKAIENNYDWNVGDIEWWDYQYEDAERIGLKISAFDMDRGNFCDLDFIQYSDDTAKLILKEHGENCDTYPIAKTFLEAFNKFNKENPDDTLSDDDDLCVEFKRELAREYLALLCQEYEYLTSEEAIRESLESNEVEFLKDGSKP